ncbi:MAG: hypothetical protein ACPG4U_07620, partial [Pseudomonadales bacterium]
MKISLKLWLGFGLLILLFGGVGLYLNVQLGQLGQRAVGAFEQPVKIVDQSRSAWDVFRTSRQFVERELSRTQFTDARNAAGQLQTYRQSLEAHLAQAQQASEALGAGIDFSGVLSQSQRWYELNQLRIGAHSQTSLPDQRGLTALEQQLAQRLESLIAESFTAVEGFRQQTASQVEQTQWLSNVLLAAALIIAVLIALSLSLTLTRPIATLTQAIQELSS